MTLSTSLMRMLNRLRDDISREIDAEVDLHRARIQDLFNSYIDQLNSSHNCQLISTQSSDSDCVDLTVAPLDLVKRSAKTDQLGLATVSGQLDLGYHSPDDPMTPTPSVEPTFPFSQVSSLQQHQTHDVKHSIANIVDSDSSVDSIEDRSADEATELNSPSASQNSDSESDIASECEHSLIDSLEETHVRLDDEYANGRVSPRARSPPCEYDLLESHQNSHQGKHFQCKQELSSRAFQPKQACSNSSVELILETNLAEAQDSILNRNDLLCSQSKAICANDKLHLAEPISQLSCSTLTDSKAKQPNKSNYKPEVIACFRQNNQMAVDCIEKITHAKRIKVKEDDKDIEVELPAVKRPKVDSQMQDFHYIPGVFFPGESTEAFLEEGEIDSDQSNRPNALKCEQSIYPLVNAEESKNVSQVCDDKKTRKDEKRTKCKKISSSNASSDKSIRPTNDTYITIKLKCLKRDCLQMFSDTKQLNVHMENEHGILPVICPLNGCSKSFHLKPTWDHHVEMEHRGETKWNCEKCSKAMFRPDSLLNHWVFKHYEGHFQCAFQGCDFFRRTRIPVRMHYLEEHCNINGENVRPGENNNKDNQVRKETPVESKYRTVRYKCTFEKCDFHYEDKRKYSRHLATVHDSLPEPCRVGDCAKSFESDQELEAHINTDHHYSEWKCKVCANRQFDNYPALNNHRHIKHLEGIFMCNRKDCKFIGKTRMLVILHYDQIHIKQEANDDKYLDYTNQSFTRYRLIHSRCTQAGCSSTFFSKERLLQHLLEAHQIHEFQCLASEHCKQSFNHIDDLYDHIRTAHKGLHHFVCFKCDKVLKQHNRLHLHMSISHYEGKFMCNQECCQFTASTRVEVLRHYDQVHVEQNKEQQHKSLRCS